ncbi:MAG: hypothetical protein JWO15_2195 [Sphingomonadales bacterium]|nr:hypothetical protein [Sphingomonadales bacterium]
MTHEPVVQSAPECAPPDRPHVMAAIDRSLSGIRIPPSLQANVDRHCDNLWALIESLGKAGVDEATIEMSVAQIMASYQAEMLANLKMLYRNAAID